MNEFFPSLPSPGPGPGSSDENHIKEILSLLGEAPTAHTAPTALTAHTAPIASTGGLSLEEFTFATIDGALYNPPPDITVDITSNYGVTQEELVSNSKIWREILKKFSEEQQNALKRSRRKALGKGYASRCRARAKGEKAEEKAEFLSAKKEICRLKAEIAKKDAEIAKKDAELNRIKAVNLITSGCAV